MKYAALNIKSKQYLVSEGDEILVQGPTFDSKEADVLLYADEGKISVGNPTVAKASVVLSTIETGVKGKKISVLKYKAKSRYRKKIGARPVFTKVKVEKLSVK